MYRRGGLGGRGAGVMALLQLADVLLPLPPSPDVAGGGDDVCCDDATLSLPS